MLQTNYRRGVNLSERPVFERHPALILSTYPNKEWNMAHAVGLDAFASAQAILDDLSKAGYIVNKSKLPLQTLLSRKTFALAYIQIHGRSLDLTDKFFKMIYKILGAIQQVKLVMVIFTLMQFNSVIPQ